MLTLTRFGLSEEQILESPIDKYSLYLEAAHIIETQNRKGFVLDVSAAVGGLFQKKGVKEYLSVLDEHME